MATASKPLGGNATYVFKMQYDAGGSAPMHRRYGYAGELALPQVYEGLHERASQTFGIPRENVVIRVRDNLGNPHLHLDSYQAFLRHVYMPLQQRPHEAKIDEKKRIVLAFVVTGQDKVKRRLAELEAEAKTLRAKMDEIERQRAKAAEAKAKKEKLERQAALAKEQAKVRAQHASARPAAAAAVAAATAAKTSRTIQRVDSAPKPAPTVVPAPSKLTPAAAPMKPAAVVSPPQADKATAWTGVQGLLEAFVENLNAHLADTFGDSAVPLDFKQLAEKKLGTTSNKLVEANKSAEANETANTSASAGTRSAKPVYHPSVFCDGCNDDLFGPRYKCLNCSNYDLCGACMDQRDSHHTASHAFAEIRFPGDKHHETTRGSTRQPPPARHAATCNLCDKTIFGARYKCLECPDFDLDSACYDTNVRELHPGHKFVRLQSPHDYVVPSVAPPLAPRHRHVRCDGCQREPIVGVRYRCMHPSCADYDLCADCEALPIPVHPHDHPLLKIRQPLDPWTDRAKVTVARDRARTLAARRESVLLGPASADGDADGGPRAGTVVDGASAPVVDASSSPVDDGPGSHTTADTVLDKLVAAADTTADTVLDKLVAAAISVQDAAAGTVAPESGAEESNREVAPEDAVEEESPAAEEQEPPAADTTAPLAPAPAPMEHSGQSAAPTSLPHATFVSDITLLDGIAVPAGAEFQKVWAVRAGPAGWPAGCRLVHVGGFSSKHFASTTTASSSFDVAAAAPNEVVSVSCDCKAPDDSGRFMDFWRLALPDSTLFGERLWIDLTIESEPVASLSSSSSSVLFMAPSLDAQGQAAAPSSTVASNLSEFESVVRSVGADSQASSSVSDSISDSEEDFVFLSGDSEEEEDVSEV